AAGTRILTTAGAGGRHTVLDPDKLAAAHALARGEAITHVAKALMVSPATLYRHIDVAAARAGHQPVFQDHDARPSLRVSGKRGRLDPIGRPGASARGVCVARFGVVRLGGFGCAGEDGDGARGAVDADVVAGVDAGGGVAGAHDGGDAEFAGDDGG